VAAAELPLRLPVMSAVCCVVTPESVALNPPENESAGMVTELGTVTIELLELTATVAPPTRAARDRVIVHVVLPPDTKLLGLHASDDTSTGAIRPIVWFAELPL
jgi:hypothetical protein